MFRPTIPASRVGSNWTPLRLWVSYFGQLMLSPPRNSQGGPFLTSNLVPILCIADGGRMATLPQFGQGVSCSVTDATLMLRSLTTLLV